MNLNTKEKLRQEIWDLLFNKKISLRNNGDYNKIPNFKGSDLAAKRLSQTIEWDESNVIFSSPDSAQIPLRKYALNDGKTLIMATPKIKNGYLIMNPENIDNHEFAATIDGAYKYGEFINELPKIDLVVEGSVCVDKLGHRLGKGGGYGDMEISYLIKNKCITENTPIATTIHPLQIVPIVPTEEHDQKINMIVTINEVIRVNQNINNINIVK
jgi:5-formyltetrahydrofolate cyclo-ligase